MLFYPKVHFLFRISFHFDLLTHLRPVRGVSRIFERGGGPISLGSLKKGHQILKGGVKWSDGGGVQYISLPKTTNLAYLDAEE